MDHVAKIVRLFDIAAGSKLHTDVGKEVLLQETASVAHTVRFAERAIVIIGYFGTSIGNVIQGILWITHSSHHHRLRSNFCRFHERGPESLHHLHIIKILQLTDADRLYIADMLDDGSVFDAPQGAEKNTHRHSFAQTR